MNGKLFYLSKHAHIIDALMITTCNNDEGHQHDWCLYHNYIKCKIKFYS